MNKAKFALWVLFILLFSVSAQAIVPPPVTDAPEGAADSATVVSKVTDKIKGGIDYVSNSEVGKAIGDGVKAAKEGIAYAKGLYDQAMEYYDQAMELKQELVNSPEFKAALISKDIAERGVALDKKRKEKQKLEDEMQEKSRLAEEEAEAKIKELEKNMGNIKVLASNSDDERSQQEVEVIQAEIEQIRLNLDATKAGLKTELESQTSAIDKDIESGAKKIASLTKKLAETANVKVDFENPLDSLNEIQGSMLMKPGDKATIKKVNEVRENRFTTRRDAIYRAYSLAAVDRYELGKMLSQAESEVELVSTMSGESERSGVVTKMLSKEMDILYRYIELEIADLQMEAAVAAGKLKMMRSSNDALGENFNLCRYFTSRNKQEGLLSQLKGAVGKGMETLNAAQEKLSEAKEALDSAKDMAKDIIPEDIENIVPTQDDLMGGMF